MSDIVSAGERMDTDYPNTSLGTIKNHSLVPNTSDKITGKRPSSPDDIRDNIDIEPQQYEKRHYPQQHNNQQRPKRRTQHRPLTNTNITTRPGGSSFSSSPLAPPILESPMKKKMITINLDQEIYNEELGQLPNQENQHASDDIIDPLEINPYRQKKKQYS